MKLLRHGPAGSEKPGVLDAEGTIRDLSAHVNDLDGAALSDASIEKLRAIDLSSLPQIDTKTRLGSCVANVGKLICVGLNYSDHAAESGMEVPPEPVLFFKATSSIVGPNDAIEIPKGSTATDWEVELAIVIGKDGKYIEESQAMDHIAGFCVLNDVSEREIADAQSLSMFLDVSGESMQKGSTSTMVYKVPFLVSYISQFMSLQAGDVISTGTPPGVGMGMKPPRYLKAGDVVSLGIEGLGEQRQDVFAHS